MKEEMKHFAILETISKLNKQDWQMEKIVKFSFENADGSDDETHRGKGDINQLSRTYHIDVPIPASEIKRSVLLIFIFVVYEFLIDKGCPRKKSLYRKTHAH